MEYMQELGESITRLERKDIESPNQEEPGTSEARECTVEYHTKEEWDGSRNRKLKLLVFSGEDPAEWLFKLEVFRGEKE